jgi:NAD(P)-dependent dehydrogenase (short-subunit alcohol dehydrogenase family)
MHQQRSQRPLAVITGAGGGIGAACARTLGRRYRLVLVDLKADFLDALIEVLKHDGVDVVAAVSGDLALPATRADVVHAVDEGGGLHGLVHTAGVSPSMASWDRIISVNLAATIDLLDALEPKLLPGAAGIMIASLAAQRFPATAEINRQLADLSSSDLPQKLQSLVHTVAEKDEALALSVAAYAVSKYAVLRLCEQRVSAWGRRGARLTTISPGLIATPMGLMEAQGNPAAAGLAEQAPAGRWGTPNDIADAAEFLLSDAASFISGCDLRVDGGLAGSLSSRASGQS